MKYYLHNYKTNLAKQNSNNFILKKYFCGTRNYMNIIIHHFSFWINYNFIFHIFHFSDLLDSLIDNIMVNKCVGVEKGDKHGITIKKK